MGVVKIRLDEYNQVENSNIDFREKVEYTKLKS